MTTLRFSGPVWIAPGDGAWHFVTVPEEQAEIIRLQSGPRVGFGSVKVEAKIGDSTWSTSVFPDTRLTYVLPLKKSVRHDEGILAGDVVDVRLKLVQV